MVRVDDDDVMEDGRPFVVMELLDGQSLQELQASQQGRIAPGWALALGWQLCDVLAAAHARGIIHRDIKPGNLFLTRKGELKVLDFGIARFRDSDGIKTTSQMTMGSPAYAAPEQIFGRQDLLDHRADIYATGATLFHLVSGQTPRGDVGYLRSLAEVMPDAPPSLVALIDRALRERTEERWPDAQAMKNAIAETYQILEGCPITSETGFRDAMRRRNSVQPDKGLPASVSLPLMDGIPSDLSVSYKAHALLWATDRLGLDATQLVEHEGPSPGENLERAVVRMPIGGVPSERTSAPYPASSHTNQNRRPSGLRGWMLGVLGCAAVLCVGLGVVLWPSSRPKPAASSFVPLASSREPRMVSLRVSALPVHARVLLDEQSVGNPATVQISADGTKHHLRAEAPDYDPATREFDASVDGPIELVLHRSAPQPAPATPIVAPTASARRKPPQIPAPMPAPPPSQAAPKPDCSHPFYMDDRGVKVVRPECR